MDRKKIFITVFHSLISKNILNTDAFKTLVNADLDIVLLVPENKKDFFKEKYSFRNVFVEGVSANKICGNKINTLFKTVAHLLVNSHYLWYKKEERYRRNKSLRNLLKSRLEIFFTVVFSKAGVFKNFFKYLYYVYPSHVEIKECFDKHKPDFLFATDIFDESDLSFIKEAKQRKVFTIGMVRSWDNCWSKGLLRVFPDKVIVNNNVIKDELAKLHGFSAGDIFVSGFPQYDHFVKEARTPKDSFFKKIGADISKKLVLFAPAGAILSDTDWQIAKIIEKALSGGEFLQPVQVLIRNHPHHPADFSKLQSDFIVETPGRNFDSINSKQTELTKEDSVHLADTLFYSDIIVWVATSLGFDAAVFNKPQIVVNFDGWKKREYLDSVKKYHDEDHMKEMLSCGGMRVVSSEQELIDAINIYLKNPAEDQTGRDCLVGKQFYKIDSLSGKRIAEFILGEINPV